MNLFNLLTRVTFLILLSSAVNSSDVGELKSAPKADLQQAALSALMEQGYFASLNPELVFSRELLVRLGAILDQAAVRDETGKPLDDAHLYGFEINWTFRVNKKVDEDLKVLLLNDTDKNGSNPKPVFEMIEAFFRYIPNGSYGVDFLLVDDFSSLARRNQAVFKINPSQPAVWFEAEPLFWHQDKFIGLPYRYLGFGIIAVEGCSPHELEIGLASQKSINKRTSKTSVIRCDNEEVEIVNKLSSLPGAMYLIDQGKNNNGRFIVHNHSGYKAEMSPTKSIPKRQKFIIRIVENPKSGRFSAE